VADLKEELHRKLQAARAALLSRLEDLDEYDLRRPMTPTGTNLLGLVKHLAGVEYEYLGESLGRPAPETMSWIEDDSIWQGADMWATPDESSQYVISLYGRACAHADRAVADLDLESPASVAHWPQDRRDTTLGVLLIRMVVETAQHAGHADIIRELIDGKAGPGDGETLSEAAWRDYLAQIQAAADSFAPGGPGGPGQASRPPEGAAERGAAGSLVQRDDGGDLVQAGDLQHGGVDGTRRPDLDAEPGSRGDPQQGSDGGAVAVGDLGHVGGDGAGGGGSLVEGGLEIPDVGQVDVARAAHGGGFMLSGGQELEPRLRVAGGGSVALRPALFGVGWAGVVSHGFSSLVKVTVVPSADGSIVTSSMRACMKMRP
jgi:hypothetical protein